MRLHMSCVAQSSHIARDTFLFNLGVIRPNLPSCKNSSQDCFSKWGDVT